MFAFYYLVSDIYCLLFDYYLDSDFLIQILKFDIYFKYIYEKETVLH